MKLTPLAIGTLTLLNERSMHPYEMYQTLVARHQDRFVKVKPGSLYHTVERLRSAKLVEATGTEREGNRPERTTYAITTLGRDALQARVAELLREPVKEFPAFPVALSEAHNLHLSEVTASLMAYTERVDELIADVQALIGHARDNSIPEAYWLSADYLLTIKAAERDWISTLLTRLSSKELPWPTPTE
jgi:DNA-binding PadR family transcriptional regulator